jgi:BASS family bile acid:Na+ symporter
MLSGTTLVLVAFLTVFLMIGIGTTLTVADFQRAVTQPRGVLIGLASQYGWMPLLGYSAAKLANLPNEMAVGLMVMTCASGGNASNLFSWFARADVALSVSMTAIAAVLSVVAMPLLLAAYASGFTTEDLQMPYQQIAATLVGMLVPLGLGMAIRHFRPTWASKLERPGMLSGALMLGIVLWAGAPDMVANVQAMTGQMLGSCLAVAASGMLLGYLAARLGGLPSAQRRAVAFETGIEHAGRHCGRAGELPRSLAATRAPHASRVRNVCLGSGAGRHRGAAHRGSSSCRPSSPTRRPPRQFERAHASG